MSTAGAPSPWAHVGRPDAVGFAPIASLPAVGRASRWSLANGAELWRLAPADAAVAARIVGLGRVGLGALVAAGSDDDGPWFVRAVHGRSTLHTLLAARAELPMPAAEAVRWAQAIGRCLVEAEAVSLLPGPLLPKQILIGPPVALTAEPLVMALAGEPGIRMDAGSSALSRWVAPDQAAGAPWDAAANRYVLGLITYRLLAGQHPFAGQGLRRRLESQSGQGAPPLPDAVARTLPPGLQALTLRILAPTPADRPRSAAALVAELAEFAGGAAGDSVDVPAGARPSHAQPAQARAADGSLGTPAPALTTASPNPASSNTASPNTASTPASSDGNNAAQEQPATTRRDPSATPALDAVVARRTVAGAPLHAARRPRSRLWSGLVAGLPLAAGIGLATVLVGARSPIPAEPDAARPIVGPTAPLTAETTRPDDCATCHPEQTAQWHLSVMAHSVKSPLFQGLEMLIEEQAGKSFDCPDGAGVLRRVDATTACRDPQTGVAITGAGGEHWCVNCHSPGNTLLPKVPAWDGLSRTSTTRRPLVDLLPASTMDGISCAFCHQVHGPVSPGDQRRGGYEGNPDWTSTATGVRFASRPEDRQGRFGIANSGYSLDAAEFLASTFGVSVDSERLVPGGAHLRPTTQARDYLASSEFCGACHDVRLFGTDVLGAAQGEHFKRLRNAYSEWEDWADDERAAGRTPASCQDCHMSTYPGVCASGEEPAPPSSASALLRGCPDGTHFEARTPGVGATGTAASASGALRELSTHYFSGVDVPLADVFPRALIDDDGLDAAGIPRGAQQRRDLLLGRTFRFEVTDPRRRGGRLDVPIVIENIGAGHRVPAGFSQEREFWVELTVTDAAGRVLYEVGHVDRGDEDLRDKSMRVNTDDRFVDDQGQPLGLFGADVTDGPDVAQWSPDPGEGGTEFFGRGLINLQNGFLRCVTCIGFVDGRGECQPGPGQGLTRSDRFDDGAYDIDTGECRSNLVGERALLETYFPVGGLDATRGVTKGPDAIIDRRSAAPNVPLRYTYELSVGGARGPLHVRARLLFRAFPPFLVRAFADYEAKQAARGKRPSGPLVTHDMLERLDVVELHRIEVEVP